MKSESKFGVGVKAVYNVNPRTVELNANGARVSCPHHLTGIGKPDHLRKNQGAVIKGFSQAASRRMREAFWGIVPLDGVKLFSVTLTVPGDIPLTPTEERKLWDRFVILLGRAASVSGGWRREHQLRGMVHWHLILAARPDGVGGVLPLSDLLSRWGGSVNHFTDLFAYVIRDVWLRSLDSLEASRQLVDKEKSFAWWKHHGIEVPAGYDYVGSRSGMLGADRYSCKVDLVDNKTGIYKYLMDHASKHKREQESTFGRAWGFIRKKHMPEFFSAPVTLSAELSERQFAVLHRILRKWCRPRVKAPSAPFGYKLGYETKRGRLGSSIWFGFPPRALEWALSNPRAIPAAVSPAGAVCPGFPPPAILPGRQGLLSLSA